MKTGLEIASDLEDMSYIERCMALRKCPECGHRLQVFQQPSSRLSCSSKKCGYMIHVEVDEHNREIYKKWATVSATMTTPPVFPLKQTSFKR
jgi:ssDNA-binding Zn-finger/Zn-ribbon topoisomerase 1